MKQFTKEELARELNISVSSITTNFPKTCASFLKQGIKITKEGKGTTALYWIEKVEPCIVDKSELSMAKKHSTESFPNEIWKICCESSQYEVSNLGRFRNANTKKIYAGYQTAKGYIHVSMGYNNIKQLHRLVLQTFDPIPNPDEYTVDHINGIKHDNRIENLRWVSNEENISLMLMHRGDLNKELTRLIQIHGYEKTLQLLKNL